MITKKSFFKKVKKIKDPIKSIRGKLYKDLYVNDKIFCFGIRCSTDTTFKVNLEKLYNAYRNNDKLNTKSEDLKYFKNAKCCSPAIAILMATGLLKNGKTIK